MEGVEVSEEESHGGGSEKNRHLSFKINCNSNEHRLQRLYYMRDGTSVECLRSGINAGMKHTVNALWSRSGFAEPSEKFPWQKMIRVEMVGLQKGVPLTDIMSRQEMKLDPKYFKKGALRLAVLEDHELFQSKSDTILYLNQKRRYVDLDDTLPLETVRSVFSPSELMLQYTMYKNKGRCLFLLPSLTKHLGYQGKKQVVLCEIDFRPKLIRFYHGSHDTKETLQFYAHIMWQQFVLPSQDMQFGVELFDLSTTERPGMSFYGMLYGVILMRTLNTHFSKQDFLQIPRFDELVYGLFEVTRESYVAR